MCWLMCSAAVLDLLEQDVSADGLGAELDVLLALGRLAGTHERGADRAGDRADVGPHRDSGRDADADVAGGVLGGELAGGEPADVQVARRGRQDHVARRLSDLEVAGPGLEGEGRAGVADLHVTGAGAELGRTLGTLD